MSLTSLLVAELVLPIPALEAAPELDKKRAKEVILQARERLEDSDVARKRRAFHSPGLPHTNPRSLERGAG